MPRQKDRTKDKAEAKARYDKDKVARQDDKREGTREMTIGVLERAERERKGGGSLRGCVLDCTTRSWDGERLGSQTKLILSLSCWHNPVLRKRILLIISHRALYFNRYFSTLFSTVFFSLNKRSSKCKVRGSQALLRDKPPGIQTRAAGGARPFRRHKRK
jgi:hypothetical protein